MRQDMLRRQGFRASLIAIVTAAVIGPVLVSDVAAAAPVDVPVLGRTVITANRSTSGTRVVVLVNGLRRIPGGTVLYYSMGAPAGAKPPASSELFLMPTERRWGAYSSTLLGNQVLYDLTARKAYTVLVDKERGNALASPQNAWQDPTGKFEVFYTVMPELPADVTTVDVGLGFGDIVHDVPVEDGALQPATPQQGPIVLGEGWPAIDQAAVAAAFKPELSIFPLDSVTSDRENSVVTRKQLDKVTVDLSGDVLFAVDKADLNPAARNRLRRAADAINDDSAGGTVTITGYTDSTGSAAHGLDLSRRRAQAVATNLRPLVTVAGIRYKTAGKGEADPVASNSTAAGRKLNRRVTISFTPKERTK